MDFSFLKRGDDLMSQCLVIPKKELEAVSFWLKLPRIGEVINAALLLSLPEVQEVLDVIKNHKVFMEREGIDGIEKSAEWQQVIFYALVMQGGKFFLYQRGEEPYKEERLRKKVSIGIGGHIEPFDTDFFSSLKREINEELKFSKNGEEILFDENIGNIKVIGLIKDEKDQVGQVHLGLVCLIELADDVQAAIRSDENVWGKMVTFDEYQQMVSSLQYVPEGWTKLLVENLLDKIQNKSA